MEAWQIALRKQFAEQNSFVVTHLDKNRIWGDYMVQAGKSHYRVAFRGVRSDRNYCACLDFRTNGLGTCKHIEAVIRHLAEEVPGYPWSERPFQAPHTSIFVNYKGGRSIECSIGTGQEQLYAGWQRKYFEGTVLPPKHYHLINQIAEEAERLSFSFRCYDDVYDMIRIHLLRTNWSLLVEKKLPDQELSSDYLPHGSESDLRRLLYQLLHTGNGIVSAPLGVSFVHPVIAMMKFVETHEPGRMLCITRDEAERAVWIKSLEDEGISYVECITVEEIKRDPELIQGLYSMVFVSSGDVLSKWTHPVSISLKKVVIRHLYIALPHLSLFSPMQFSSIVQHIEPYLLGATYLFIERAKSFFPLTDVPERLPDMLRGLVSFLPESAKQLSLGAVKKGGQGVVALDISDQEEEQLLIQILRTLRDVIKQPERRERLIDAIDQLIDGHEV